MPANTKNRSVAKGKRRGRTKRILGYTGLAIAIIVGGVGGFGLYEYHHLQPETYINPTTRPTVGRGNATIKEKNGTFNMLLIGSDARPGDTVSHSDSMILIHVDLNKHQYNMVSIPRDTRVYMPGYGYTKLTSVQLVAQAKEGTQQGIVTAVQSISQLTGVPINFYAETNYWGLRDMVDALGGITMKLPFPVTITHAWYPEDQGLHLAAGDHFFDGKMVTEVVHERYSLPGTDYGRQQLQEEALIGIAKTVMSPSHITDLPQLSQTLPKFLIATNMSRRFMLSIGLGMKQDFNPQQQIHYDQLKGPSESVYDQVLGANNDEVIIPQSQIQAMVKKDFS